MSEMLRSNTFAGAVGAADLQAGISSAAPFAETAHASLSEALARVRLALETGGRKSSDEAVRALRQSATREQRAQNAVIAVNAADPIDVLELIPGAALPAPSFAGHREQARAWCCRAPLAQRIALLRVCAWLLPTYRRGQFAVWARRNVGGRGQDAPAALPVVAWERFRIEAEEWAVLADIAELAAYLVEIWRTVPRHEQIAMLGDLCGRE